MSAGQFYAAPPAMGPPAPRRPATQNGALSAGQFYGAAPNPANAAAPAPAGVPAGRPRSRFANRREEYFQMARSGIQVGPPASGNRQPPVEPEAELPPPPDGGGGGGGGRPPAAAPARSGAAIASAPAAAAKMMAEPAGTPIAPGARDLLDAGAQLQALGLGRSAASAAPGFDWSKAGVTGAEGAAKVMDVDSWKTSASFDFNQPEPPGAAAMFAADAPKLDLGLKGDTGVAFDAAAGGTAGPSSEEDLAMRRRRAFLDAPDSLEGMRRARLVMADEIAARGGDLQKFAADSGQMRPMSMKQLEGYMAQVQNGQAPAAAASAAQATAFDPAVASTPAADTKAAFAPGLDLRKVVGGAAGAAPANFNMAAGVDEALRQRGQEAFRLAGNGTLAYQTGPQPVGGISGEPNQTAFAAAAAQGVDPAALAPAEMRQMYGATNALALGLGAPKAGATTRLPQLTPEQVEQMRRMANGPSFVTPPAGFDFYNRR